MDSKDVGAVVAVLIVFVFIAGIWGTLIFLGIRAAKKRNRSPHWMWFGLHPVGALIACIVLNCLSPLRICPKCAQKSQLQARVCPYCAQSFEGAAPGSPAFPTT